MPTRQYYGSWLWDDTGGAFISSGLVYIIGEQNIGIYDNMYYYFGYQRPGEMYQEVLTESPYPRNTGNANSVTLRRNWSDPYNSFVLSYYELGPGDSTAPQEPPAKALTFYVATGLQPERSTIGMDVRGSQISVNYTSWHNNLYILNDGSYYPHRGMQDGQNIDYPPVACYWRPRPTDYGSIGGNLECEAP